MRGRGAECRAAGGYRSPVHRGIRSGSSGASSVRRSSREGCRRSSMVLSAMRFQPSADGAEASPAVSCAASVASSTRLRRSISATSPVSGWPERALAEPDKCSSHRHRPSSVRLARISPPRRCFLDAVPGIARRHKSGDLAAILQRNPRAGPDRVAQVRRLVDMQSRGSPSKGIQK